MPVSPDWLASLWAPRFIANMSEEEKRIFERRHEYRSDSASCSCGAKFSNSPFKFKGDGSNIKFVKRWNNHCNMAIVSS